MSQSGTPSSVPSTSTLGRPVPRTHRWTGEDSGGQFGVGGGRAAGQFGSFQLVWRSSYLRYPRVSLVPPKGLLHRTRPQRFLFILSRFYSKRSFHPPSRVRSSFRDVFRSLDRRRILGAPQPVPVSLPRTLRSPDGPGTQTGEGVTSACRPPPCRIRFRSTTLGAPREAEVTGVTHHGRRGPDSATLRSVGMGTAGKTPRDRPPSHAAPPAHPTHRARGECPGGRSGAGRTARSGRTRASR